MADNWKQYVLMYFPKATEADVSHILWGRTCFPFGRPSEIKRQIQGLRRAFHRSKKAGRSLCDHCPNLASEKHKWTCDRCWNALHPTP